MFEIWKMAPEELRKFLKFDKRKTLIFWLESLRKITPRKGRITEAQLHYGARFLTRASLVPAGTEINFKSVSEIYFPTFTTLFELLTKILDLPRTPETSEIAACQILILSGFYQDYARRHYNINDLRNLGQDLFKYSAIGKRKAVIKQMAENYGRWQDLLLFLKTNLEEEARLIHIPSAPEPLIKIVRD